MKLITNSTPQRVATERHPGPALLHFAPPLDRARKARPGASLLWQTIRTRSDVVVVMHGTGVAGGVALLAARAVAEVPFAVSSGDAVGPFLACRAARSEQVGQEMKEDS